MCTLALYLGQFENHPLVIAANRDEHFSRPSAAPRILSESPMLLAGKDLLAGGTWLGVNAHGVAAAIVNRRIKVEKAAAAPRSRGLLCLDMLKAGNVAQAREWLRREDGSNYRPFLLLIASAEAAFVVFNSGNAIERLELEAGLHVFSNTSLTGHGDGKLDRAHKLFSNAAASLKSQFKGTATAFDGAVRVLRGVLSDHEPATDSQEPRDAICVHAAGDYGTVSSSIIFHSPAEKKFYFYHASGSPCRAEFEPVEPLKLL